eukprot:5949386-Prymnesium_polylepis.1
MNQTWLLRRVVHSLVHLRVILHGAYVPQALGRLLWCTETVGQHHQSTLGIVHETRPNKRRSEARALGELLVPPAPLAAPPPAPLAAPPPAPLAAPPLAPLAAPLPRDRNARRKLPLPHDTSCKACDHVWKKDSITISQCKTLKPFAHSARSTIDHVPRVCSSHTLDMVVKCASVGHTGDARDQQQD